MLERGSLIEDVLILLGNISGYNDNLSDEYLVASRLLDNSLSDINKNRRLLFNALTEKLNYSQLEKTEQDEYIYYRPSGLLNLLSPSSLRMEGEYIFSKDKDAIIQYSRQVPFNEIPDYLEDLIKGTLGIKMAIAFSQYNDKLTYFQQMVNEELARIQSNELSGADDYLSKSYGTNNPLSFGKVYI